MKLKMKIKRIVLFSFFAATAIILSQLSWAITASIGNSRMVLRIGVGENVERYILVKNVNDESVTIILTSSGDLADNIKLKENSFILAPGEEKKAYFGIIAKEAGTKEGRINVEFKPEEGNSAGLASIVTVIADEKYAGQDRFISGGYEGNNKESEESSYNSPESDNEIKVEKNIGPSALIISSVALLGILILLYFYSLTIKHKKRVAEVNA